MAARGMGRGARIGLLLGSWLGVVDGGLALHRAGVTAGPLVDRLGSVGVAIALDAVVGAVLVALLALVLGRRLPAPSWPISLGGGFAALLAGAVVGGVLGREPPPAPGERLNLLLVSVDTLRADHLGAYGYARDTSPNLDALAREGVLFQNAYSHSSWTLTSHVSMFTGLDPFAHRVLSPEDHLSESHDTLARQLSAVGYWTGGWVGTWPFGYVGARYGMDRGFQVYRHYPHPRRFRSAFLARRLDRIAFSLLDEEVGNARAEIDSVLRWLRAGRREPFFAFVHLYDTHSKFRDLPYEAPPPFRSRFCEGALDGFTGCGEGGCASDRLLAVALGKAPPPSERERELARCLYDGAIAFVDHELGRLFRALDREGLLDRTAVFVTADHGEAFFEHGVPLHRTLHDEITRVPLIARVPGAARGKRVQGSVRLIDLAPTLLDLAGAPPDPDHQGRSLVGVIRSWPEDAHGAVVALDREQRAQSLRSGSSKLIEGPEPGATELYDTARDAAEAFDLSAREPERVERLRAELLRRRRESEALGRRLGLAEGSGPELSAEERERLRALGYVDEEP